MALLKCKGSEAQKTDVNEHLCNLPAQGQCHLEIVMWHHKGKHEHGWAKQHSPRSILGHLSS